MSDLARASMPFCAELGITTRHASAAEVVLTIDWSPEGCTVGGAMHGGVVVVTELRNNGRRVAVTTQTQSVLFPRNDG